jgi:hypothetical protein
MGLWTLTLVVALLVGRGVVSSLDDASRREQDICSLYQQRLHISSFVSEEGSHNADPESSGDTTEVEAAAEESEEAIENVTREVATEKNVTSNGSVEVHKKILKDGGDSDQHIIYDNVKATKSNSTHNQSGTEEGNSSGKEPFAKQQVTVKEHDVAVNVSDNESLNVTIKETVKVVEVASATSIVSIYIVLFVPVITAWLIYVHLGMQPKHYVILVPLTLCVMSVGQDLVNQSLIMIIEAPYTVSCVHAYCMAFALGLWMVIIDPPNFQKMPVCKLSYWLIVAVLFAIYQLVNHVVYSTCTLSERIVFQNLCPLVSLLCEKLLMPMTLKPLSSFSGKMALALMLVGAILFSLQNPTFSLRGVAMASTLVFTQIPYRLAQRSFLGDGAEFPITLLVFLDGLVLSFPSTAIAAARMNYFRNMDRFLSELSVSIMLVLSIITFVGQHICTLAMLRLGSATNYLVLQSIAGLMTISMGIIFFGDRVLATPLACIGLSANLACGVWYAAVETMPMDDVKDPLETSDTDKKDNSS